MRGPDRGARLNSKELRCCVAEFIGTFAIVFFGCGAIATMPGPTAPVGVNLVFGIAVATMVFALGRISCAHFNPAVTIAFAAIRRFPWRMVVPYIASQFAGAFAGSACLYAALPRPMRFGETVSVLGPGGTVAIEAIVTAFLMFTILAVVTNQRVSELSSGIAIGSIVTMGGLFAGPLTGNSLNPARSLAPAAFAGGPALSGYWQYVVGPVFGALLGAVAYRFLLGPAAAQSDSPVSCCAED